MIFMNLKGLNGEVLIRQKHGEIEVIITQTKIGPRGIYYVYVFEQGRQISNHDPMHSLEEATLLFQVHGKSAKAIASNPFFAITHEYTKRKKAFPKETEARRIAGITATLKHNGIDINTNAVKRTLEITRKMQITPAPTEPKKPKKEFKPTKLRLLPKPPHRK